jgi:hypothetical protein
MSAAFTYLASSIAQVAAFDCSMTKMSANGQPYLIYSHEKWIPEQYEETIKILKWDDAVDVETAIIDSGQVRAKNSVSLRSASIGAAGVALSFDGINSFSGELRFNNWKSKAATWRTHTMALHEAPYIDIGYVNEGTCKILKLRKPSRSFLRNMQ